MAGKDDFKFDDDAFPETDLSEAFSEGEQSVVPQEPRFPEYPEYPMTISKGGGSRTRLLLLLLLLVAAAGGGVYYFLIMEDPALPTPPPMKVVAVAPKPPPPPVAPAPSGAPAQVSVPPPAVPPAVPAGAATVSVPPPPRPAASPPVPSPVPEKAAAVAVPPPKPAAPPAPVAAKAPPAPVAAKAPPAQAAPVASVGGPWQVEAGTYLNSAALKAAEAKIRALGYEPQVSTLQKSVRMIRLRIGTVAEGRVKEALELARAVVPDAFALRSGAMYAVYAGTFTNRENLRQLSAKLAEQGFSVVEEPVEVPRTINLVRFGGFADQSAAAAAANRAQQAGIAAAVVKTR
jgi:hypothetical protein